MIDTKDIILISLSRDKIISLVSFSNVLPVVYVKTVKNSTGYPALSFENGQNTNDCLYFLITYF